MRKTLLLPAVLAVGLAGCADLTATQQRTLTQLGHRLPKSCSGSAACRAAAGS